MDYSNIIGSVITAAATVGGLWIEKRLKERKKPDLSDEDYDDLIGETLEFIREKMVAKKVCYVAFHNGDKTYDGYSLKNLSMMAERFDEKTAPSLTDWQKVPVVTVRRYIVELRKLTAENPVFVSYETSYNDKLSDLCKADNSNTIILLKILNTKKKNQFTGYAAVVFEEIDRPVTKGEIAYLSYQVSKINEAITSKV